jgi:hypothetical protein
LQRSDDGDRFTAARSGVSGTEFGEPHSPVFLHDDAGRALGRVRSLPVWKCAQMPVDGWLTEMQSGYRGDVEAAKLRSLLARRHVNASDLGQVVVSGGAGRLCSQVADGHDLKGTQEQYEYADGWSSDHRCSVVHLKDAGTGEKRLRRLRPGAMMACGQEIYQW